MIDIEFNFYGNANIQRSIRQLFISSLTKQQAKAQIVGRTFSQTTETGSFTMSIDGLMVKYDEKDRNLFVIEIFGHDDKRSLYFRKTFDRHEYEEMRYPGTLLDELMEECDTTHKAVFL
jgi:hypothetical protein